MTPAALSAVARLPIGPFPLTLKCRCNEWAASVETLDDLRKGYSFVCPDCKQTLRIAKDSK